MVSILTQPTISAPTTSILSLEPRVFKFFQLSQILTSCDFINSPVCISRRIFILISRYILNEFFAIDSCVLITVSHVKLFPAAGKVAGQVLSLAGTKFLKDPILPMSSFIPHMVQLNVAHLGSLHLFQVDGVIRYPWNSSFSVSLETCSERYN